MSHKPTAWIILVSALTGIGCSSIQPAESVSAAVIGSLIAHDKVSTKPSQPWRLDSAWQGGELAGSAFRAASIEHVVRQIDRPLSVANTRAETGTQTSVGFKLPSHQTRDYSNKPQQLSISRAWRKYCHHQLDMTPAEHALIAQTSVPFEILKQGCNPGSLLK